MEPENHIYKLCKVCVIMLDSSERNVANDNCNERVTRAFYDYTSLITIYVDNYTGDLITVWLMAKFIG